MNRVVIIGLILAACSARADMLKDNNTQQVVAIGTLSSNDGETIVWVNCNKSQSKFKPQGQFRYKKGNDCSSTQPAGKPNQEPPPIMNPSGTNPSETNPSINPSGTNPSETNPSINPSITNPSITNPSNTNPSSTEAPAGWTTVPILQPRKH